MSYNTLFENLESAGDTTNMDDMANKMVNDIEMEYKNLKNETPANDEFIKLNDRLITLKKQLNATKNNKNIHKSKLNDNLAAKRKQIREEIQNILVKLEEIKK